jgi:hypothetical protein
MKEILFRPGTLPEIFLTHKSGYIIFIFKNVERFIKFSAINFKLQIPNHFSFRYLINILLIK